MLPNENEQRAVRSYKGDLTRLEPCDRFFKIISEVEHADDRLGCMLCVRQFPGQIDDLLAKVDCVSQACSEIRSSPMLKIVLEVALRIGNQLNRLGHEAEAHGGGIRAFSLRSLVKLSQTKSYDKKTTVLHVIAKYALLKKKDKDKAEKKDEVDGESAGDTEESPRTPCGKGRSE